MTAQKEGIHFAASAAAAAAMGIIAQPFPFLSMFARGKYLRGQPQL